MSTTDLKIDDVAIRKLRKATRLVTQMAGSDGLLDRAALDLALHVSALLDERGERAVDVIEGAPDSLDLVGVLADLLGPASPGAVRSQGSVEVEPCYGSRAVRRRGPAVTSASPVQAWPDLCRFSPGALLYQCDLTSAASPGRVTSGPLPQFSRCDPVAFHV